MDLNYSKFKDALEKYNNNAIKDAKKEEMIKDVYDVTREIIEGDKYYFENESLRNDIVSITVAGRRIHVNNPEVFEWIIRSSKIEALLTPKLDSTVELDLTYSIRKEVGA